MVLSIMMSVSVNIGWNRYQTNKKFFKNSEKIPISLEAPEGNYFYAGTAQKIITPYESEYLGGFSFNRKSTGAHDNLYAKALVLKDAYGIKIVVVSLDLLGFLRPDVLQIQKEVELRGIAFQKNIIITSTHTHSAPDVIGYYGNLEIKKARLVSGRNPAYARFVAYQIMDAIEEANNHLEPVNLYTSMDSCKLCSNKRFPEIIDNEIRSLFVSYKSGKIMATIVNFGCHPEVLNRHNKLITADWPGFMYDELENKLGGKVFFINGALGGMVTPKDKGTYELAKKFGVEIASNVIESHKKSVKISVPQISVLHQEISIPLENKIFKYLIMFGIVPNGTLVDGKIITEVNYIKIGELNIITVPGEITPQIGLAIKKQLSEPKMVWSLVNDEIGYIIQKEDWSHEKYSYERTMSLGPETGENIMEAVITALKNH